MRGAVGAADDLLCELPGALLRIQRAGVPAADPADIELLRSFRRAERTWLRFARGLVRAPLATYFLAGIASGDLEDAARLYKQASVFDNFEQAGEAAFRRGTILEELADSDAAGAYERGAELGNAKAASNLANVQLRCGRVKAATSSYERALALSDPTIEAQIAFSYANMLDEHARVEDAKPIYERAAELDEPWSQVRLAGLVAEAQDLDVAVAHLEAARRCAIPAVDEAVASLALDLGIELGDAGAS